MAFTYPETTDPVIGTNDPLFANTWDELEIQIQEALEVEHTANGSHYGLNATDAGPCFCESGTYTGQVAELVVSLTATNLRILLLQVWSEVSVVPNNYIIWKAYSMSGKYAKTSIRTAFVNNCLTLSDGSFTVDASAPTYLDDTDSTFYWMAWGILIDEDDYSLTGNGNTIALNWAQHGESILLDANNDGPNTRAGKQIETRYLVEHTSAGAHTDGAIPFIESLTWTGDGTNSQVVNLALSTSTPKRIMIFQDNTAPPFIIDTQGVWSWDRSLLINGGQASLGVGTLTIEDSDGDNIPVCLLHSEYGGESNFWDASGLNLTVTPVSVAHSITEQYAGASSIYFDATGDAIVVTDSNDVLEFDGDFSIHFYINTTSAAFGALCARNYAGGGAKFYVQIEAATGLVQAGVTDEDTNSVAITGTTDVTTGAWFEIELKRVSGTVSLEIDGSSEGTPGSAGGVVTGGNISIGNVGVNSFIGYMDEFRIEKEGTGITYFNVLSQEYHAIVFS